MGEVGKYVYSFICGFVLAVLVCAWMDDTLDPMEGRDLEIKTQAVEHGHAEYYLDADHNKQFRWKPTPMTVDLEALKKKLDQVPKQGAIRISALERVRGNLSVAYLDLTPDESRVVLAAAVNAERAEELRKVLKDILNSNPCSHRRDLAMYEGRSILCTIETPMTDELANPCVGCGKHPDIRLHGKEEWTIIKCQECEKMFGPSPDRGEAIRLWNADNPNAATQQEASE